MSTEMAGDSDDDTIDDTIDDTDDDTDDIEALRGRIAELDSAVIRLLGERFAHVRLLGRWKALAQDPIEDPARESELRALYLQAAQREGLDPALVLRVFAVVHEHSKAEQRAQGRRPKTAG
jgi:chorismate mutase